MLATRSRRPASTASRALPQSVRGRGSSRRTSCIVSVEPPKAARPRSTSRPKARTTPTRIDARVAPEAPVLGGERRVHEVRRHLRERDPRLAAAGAVRVLAQDGALRVEHRERRRRARLEARARVAAGVHGEPPGRGRQRERGRRGAESEAEEPAALHLSLTTKVPGAVRAPTSG